MYEASVPPLSQETSYLAAYRRQYQSTNVKGSANNVPLADARDISTAEFNT